MAKADDHRRAVIAVVDDDRGVLEALEGLLASADYDVRLHSSAASLLESGCLREADCLISDLGMPGMDGQELARVARTTRPGLPVILVTGRPDLLNRSLLERPDQCRVFTKPFNGQALLTAVDDVLRSQDPRKHLR